MKSINKLHFYIFSSKSNCAVNTYTDQWSLIIVILLILHYVRVVISVLRVRSTLSGKSWVSNKKSAIYQKDKIIWLFISTRVIQDCPVLTPFG